MKDDQHDDQGRLEMTPTSQELYRLKEAKLINCQQHPTAPYTIWNYTNKCQFAKAWDFATMAARGLILNDVGGVVARGPIKFFNYGERPDDKIPDCPFKVLEKVDGSLGILYFTENGPEIATRGSFTGPQTARATLLFRRRYFGYKPPAGTTAVFEIVYPEDRKVVDYGNTNELFHLGLVDNETGLMRFDLDPDWPGPTAFEYPQQSMEELVTCSKDNLEGFVVRWQNGFQLKIKLAEYLRIFKIMYSTSTRSIWEALMNGEALCDLLEEAPDEVYSFIKTNGEQLLQTFADTQTGLLQKFSEIVAVIGRNDRKAFAEYACKTAWPAVLFAMYDSKNHAKIIWKNLEPEWVPAKAMPSEDVA